MKKNIYKEIPESFHKQFSQTLMELEDSPLPSSNSNNGKCSSQTATKKRKPPRKKYGLLLAAAILVCACATVAATGLMGWHERMSTRFGTDKNLEDKLSAEQVAIPQSASVDENRLKFQALQAVRTDSYDYFLLLMTVPEEIDWNDDIIFEDAQVIDQDFGCVVNIVNDSLKNHTVLLEVQLFYSGEAAPSSKEIRIRLKNLVQTQKTEVTSSLIEGEWEIPLTPPSAEANTVRFYPQQPVTLGEHEIHLTQADISPFQLRLYTDKEFVLHAVWGHSIFLVGVHSKDGSFVEEGGLTFSLSGHSDESGNFCFEFPLENAVVPENITDIVINDSGEERVLFLTEIPGTETLESQMQTDSELQAQTGSAMQSQSLATQNADQQSAFLAIAEQNGPLTDFKLLYVKYENVVLADDSAVYLWDSRCGRFQELFSLKEYNFSWENGGEVSLGQASQILLLPYNGSSNVYLYNIASREMLTLEAAAFWPWPTHESYLANCKNISEVIPDANEKYSGEAFFSQGKWYYLYSEDGSIQNMELRSQE